MTSPGTFPRAPAVTDQSPAPAGEGSPERPENSKHNCAPRPPPPFLSHTGGASCFFPARDREQT